MNLESRERAPAGKRLDRKRPSSAGILLCVLTLLGAASAEDPPAPAPAAGAEVDISRERIQELLGLYLASDSRKDRSTIEEQFIAMEAAGMTPQSLHEVMAFGEAYPRDRRAFDERGKQGVPKIEWQSQRVTPKELGWEAPDFYTISYPRDYIATGAQLYPAIIDIGGGVASTLTGGVDHNGVLCVFIHPDAVPSQGFLHSRQGQALLLSVLQDLPLRAWVDLDRVFLTGGGHFGDGVYYLASHYPHLFAGALPYDGMLQDFRMFERNTRRLGWMFVSTNPGPRNLQHYEFNFDSLERMRKLGGNAHFRLLDTDIDPRSFASEAHEFINKTFREPWPASFEFRMNDSDHDACYWVSIDKVLKPGNPIILKIRDAFGGTSDTRTINTEIAEVKAEVSEDRKRVTIQATNVLHLTVCLSPTLVDWDSEVEIVVNGKSRYHEKPKASVRLMLLKYRSTRDASSLPWCRVQILKV